MSSLVLCLNEDLVYNKKQIWNKLTQIYVKVEDKDTKC